jgi:hypothetical protein
MIFYFLHKNLFSLHVHFKKVKNAGTGADFQKEHSLSNIIVFAVCTANSKYSTGTGTQKELTQ